ncbi:MULTISPECIES: alkaline phosphatase D family protein [unclassified Pseudomonas]
MRGIRFSIVSEDDNMSPFGPVLSFRGIQNQKYCVSALLVQDLNAPAPTTQVAQAHNPTIKRIARIPLIKPRMAVWRLDMQIQQSKTQLKIDYDLGDVSGSFHVPPLDQAPRIAYTSCNGVSDVKYLNSLADRYAERWSHLAQTHKQAEYHLLVMGGDQIYSDELLQTQGPLNEWYKQFSWNRDDTLWTEEMEVQADEFFASVYPRYWARPQILKMLSCVPTLMMWDDHDIIDGWGSYPQALHESPVHQGLFRIASYYFRLYQLQVDETESRPGAITRQGHTFAFEGLGGLAIVVPDLRSERAPDIKGRNGQLKQPTQIMSQKSISQMFTWIKSLTVSKPSHLLFISSVPVSFVNLALLEALIGWIPGEIGPEDDFRDHWRHQPHKNERKQLINGLLDFAKLAKCKVTIVSGDVHVAAASVIRSANPRHIDNGAEVIHQLISTGIVHPPLPVLTIRSLETITATREKIDTDLTAEMQAIGYDGNCLIASRNWLSIEPDKSSDGRNRLWVKWHVEGHAHPITRLIEPAG